MLPGIKTGSVDLNAFLKSGAFICTPGDQVFLGWGSQAASDSPSRGAFYLSDFYMKNKNPWICFEQTIQISREELLSLLADEDSSPINAKFTSPSRDEWNRKFSAAKKLISSGEIQKIVPVIRAFATSTLNIKNLVGLIVNSLRSRHGLAYGHWTGGTGFVGVTPEILFSIKNNFKELQTMSLAGTHSLNMEDGSLLSSKKDLHEHQIVVSDIGSQLKKFGAVTQGKTFEYKNETLKHLRTDIKLNSDVVIDVSQLLYALHPTPALGVAPRSELSEFEAIFDANRGSYGAPFGFFPSESGAHFLVAIRNMSWSDEMISIWSGCGVVDDSDENLEWEELSLKRSSVKKALGIFE